MKPNSHSKNFSQTDAHSFPRIDSNYRIATMPHFHGSCTRYDFSSFRNISGEYFRKEARGEFQLEFTAFAAIIVTAALPILSNLHALAQLAGALGSF